MLSLREKHRDKILLLHRIIIVHDGARLVAIDVLSKYAVVVPMLVQWKPQISWVRNQKKIYTDERAIAGEDFKEYVEGENIVLHRTRSHPAFAERMTYL